MNSIGFEGDPLLYTLMCFPNSAIVNYRTCSYRLTGTNSDRTVSTGGILIINMYKTKRPTF